MFILFFVFVFFYKKFVPSLYFERHGRVVIYLSARSIRSACVDAATAATAEGGEGSDDVGAVVAVLGAAHLNGVQLRLMEEEEEEE